jgi:hypothetical protein
MSGPYRSQTEEIVIQPFWSFLNMLLLSLGLLPKRLYGVEISQRLGS